MEMTFVEFFVLIWIQILDACGDWRGEQGYLMFEYVEF